tara:strand:- start:145 stop:435 length:291 start_codon:yes stop_codon:yes gene_type:complete
MKLTEKAQQQISETIGGGFLRIAVNGGGCSGFRIELSKEIGLSDGDELISGNVVSDTTSLALLNEVEMDYQRDPFGSGFVFNHPHQTCGCGASFQL